MKTKNYKLLIIISSMIVVLVGFGVSFANFSKIKSWLSPYENITEYSRGIKLARLKNNKEVLLDSLGKRISPVFDEIGEEVGDSLVSYNSDGYCGFFNILTKTNQIPSHQRRFSEAWEFDPETGLAGVVDATNDKIGFINRKGMYVIAPQFFGGAIEDRVEQICIFNSKECIVPDSYSSFKVIDTKGNNKYGNTSFSYISESSNGFRAVADLVEYKFGLVNGFNIILPCEYDGIELTDSEIYLSKDGVKWGLNYNLKLKSPMVFDQVCNLYFEDDDSEYDGNEDGEIEESLPKQTVPRYSLLYISDYLGLFDNLTKKIAVPAVYDMIYVTGNPSAFTVWGEKNGMIYLLK